MTFDDEESAVTDEDEAPRVELRYKLASKERQAQVLDVLAEFLAERLRQVKKDA